MVKNTSSIRETSFIDHTNLNHTRYCTEQKKKHKLQAANASYYRERVKHFERLLRPYNRTNRNKTCCALRDR